LVQHGFCSIGASDRPAFCGSIMAPTSGGAASGETPVVAAKDLDEQLTLCSHERYVTLHEIAHREYMIVHSKSLERRKLPSKGHWELCFDEDGFGAVEISDDPLGEVLILEDFLLYALYVNERNDFFLCATSGASVGQLVSLSEFALKFVESTISITFSPCAKSVELDVTVLSWPRNGAKVFLSLPSLYAALGFDQFGGESWRWVHAGKERWKRKFDLCGLQDHLQKSCCMGKKESPTKDEFWQHPGDLSYHAVSFAGLVVLMETWAFKAKRFGGIESESGKLTSRWLLDKFLKALTEKGPYVIDIDVAPYWVPRWPLPAKQHSLAATITIQQDGGVVFGSWADLAIAGGKKTFAHKSWSVITQGFLGARDTSLACLLNVLCTDQMMDGIHNQVVWKIGWGLQDLCLKSMRAEAVCSTFQCTQVDIDDLFDKRGRCDAQLYRYVAACHANAEGQQFWSSSVDKAAVGGTVLQPCLFVLPCNLGLVAPTAVGRSQFPQPHQPPPITQSPVI
jgi:hypothetical protein